MLTTSEPPAPWTVVRPPGPSALPRAPTRSSDHEPRIESPGRIQAMCEGHVRRYRVRGEEHPWPLSKAGKAASLRTSR
jgi:hypothetical protein